MSIRDSRTQRYGWGHRDEAIVTPIMRITRAPIGQRNYLASAAQWRFRTKIRGTDTVFTQPDSFGGKTFRRPHCNDPRLEPLTRFISGCS